MSTANIAHTGCIELCMLDRSACLKCAGHFIAALTACGTLWSTRCHTGRLKIVRQVVGLASQTVALTWRSENICQECKLLAAAYTRHALDVHLMHTVFRNLHAAMLSSKALGIEVYRKDRTVCIMQRPPTLQQRDTIAKMCLDGQK